MQRCFQSDDAARQVAPLNILARLLADLRGNRDDSIVWQDIGATGAGSPKWSFSEHARKAGAEGALYSSRSRPDLAHLVLFKLTVILDAGTPRPVPEHRLP